MFVTPVVTHRLRHPGLQAVRCAARGAPATRSAGRRPAAPSACAQQTSPGCVDWVRQTIHHWLFEADRSLYILTTCAGSRNSMFSEPNTKVTAKETRRYRKKTCSQAKICLRAVCMTAQRQQPISCRHQACAAGCPIGMVGAPVRSSAGFILWQGALHLQVDAAVLPLRLRQRRAGLRLELRQPRRQLRRDLP